MGYRNLVIQNDARLYCRHDQLFIQTDTLHSVPLEDISAILLESQRSTVTLAALSALAQNGVAVLVCDAKHLPCGTLLPFSQHSRQAEVFRAQAALTKPAQNRLWQQLIQAKIHNQAECMALCGKPDEAALLHALAGRVSSGDSTNQEAVAAAYYFSHLFGSSFTRGDEQDTRNSALNYGYAILRGQAARFAAVYGFQPCVGLHHCSGLNAFNLADDLMEPFRPVVDLFVAANVDEDARFEPPLKHALFGLTGCDILSGEQHHSVTYAMERLVQSLVRNLEQKAPLLTPALLPLQQHRYE